MRIQFWKSKSFLIFFTQMIHWNLTFSMSKKGKKGVVELCLNKLYGTRPTNLPHSVITSVICVYNLT